MDVLRPPIVNIGGRLYRKNPTPENIGWDEAKEVDAPYVEEFSCEDGACGLDDVKQTDGGYEIRMNVPSAFYGYIIGKKAETKKKIESETGANIIIPKGRGEEEITLKSEIRRNVVAAKERITLLVDSARQKQPFTHFLSIPLIAAEISEAVIKFKTDVLETCPKSGGLNETMFQKPEHLHLTLGTMVLMNEYEVEKARILLDKCKTSIISGILQGNPLEVSIAGLEYMNDDPAEVDVLYCKVQPTDNSNKLQLLADSIVEQFISEDLMSREYDHVKIHATLINSLFNKETDGEMGNLGRNNKRRDQKIRKSFDARDILEIFGDYSFAICQLNDIHISIKGSKSTGYYRNDGIISLS